MSKLFEILFRTKKEGDGGQQAVDEIKNVNDAAGSASGGLDKVAAGGRLITAVLRGGQGAITGTAAGMRMLASATLQAAAASRAFVASGWGVIIAILGAVVSLVLSAVAAFRSQTDELEKSGAAAGKAAGETKTLAEHMEEAAKASMEHARQQMKDYGDEVDKAIATIDKLLARQMKLLDARLALKLAEIDASDMTPAEKEKASAETKRKYEDMKYGEQEAASRRRIEETEQAARAAESRLQEANAALFAATKAIHDIDMETRDVPEEYQSGYMHDELNTTERITEAKKAEAAAAVARSVAEEAAKAARDKANEVAEEEAANRTVRGTQQAATEVTTSAQVRRAEAARKNEQQKEKEKKDAARTPDEMAADAAGSVVTGGKNKYGQTVAGGDEGRAAVARGKDLVMEAYKIAQDTSRTDAAIAEALQAVIDEFKEVGAQFRGRDAQMKQFRKELDQINAQFKYSGVR